MTYFLFYNYFSYAKISYFIHLRYKIIQNHHNIINMTRGKVMSFVLLNFITSLIKKFRMRRTCTLFLSALLPIRFFSTSSSSYFRPLSSFKESKATLRKVSDVPQNPSFENGKRRDDGGLTEDGEGGLGEDAAVKATILAGFLLVRVVGGFGTAGYVYEDQINAFLVQFSGFIDGAVLSPYEFCLVYFGRRMNVHMWNLSFSFSSHVKDEINLA